MTLSPWDSLPLRTRHKVRLLYNHLQDNTSDALDDWEDLDMTVRLSRRRLWTYVATALEGLPVWKELPYRMKISREARWGAIYDSLVGDKRVVTITVTDGVDPLGGAEVTIGSTTKITDPKGKVKFPGISDGSTTVSVECDGYEDESKSVTVSRTAFSFTVAMEILNPVTITVTDGTDPLEDATVTIGTVDKTTDDKGVTTWNLEDDTFTVTTVKSGYVTDTSSIEVDDDHTEFTIELSIVTDTLTIVVTEADETPIEGATVVIGEDSETTDSTGTATFTDMPYDDYAATISATSFVTKTNEPIAFRSNHKNFTIALESGE